MPYQEDDLDPEPDEEPDDGPDAEENEDAPVITGEEDAPPPSEDEEDRILDDLPPATHVPEDMDEEAPFTAKDAEQVRAVYNEVSQGGNLPNMVVWQGRVYRR